MQQSKKYRQNERLIKNCTKIGTFLWCRDVLLSKNSARRQKVPFTTACIVHFSERFQACKFRVRYKQVSAGGQVWVVCCTGNWRLTRQVNDWTGDVHANPDTSTLNLSALLLPPTPFFPVRSSTRQPVSQLHSTVAVLILWPVYDVKPR